MQELITMEDIIEDMKEYDMYIADLEDGEYNKWLQKYPDNKIEIFRDLIDYNKDNLVNLYGFEDFLNTKSEFSTDLNEPIYPLEAVAEFRKMNNFEVLLKWGAKSSNGNVLMSLLQGHSPDDCTNDKKNITDVEKGIINLQLHEHPKSGEFFPENWKEEFSCYSESQIIMNILNQDYYKFEN